MRINRLYIIIISITLYSCGNSSESIEEKAIRDMMEKFPQLIQEETESYKFQRSVIVGDNNICLSLYSMEKGTQSFITITNSIGECAAIPLLSNIYIDYWNFEFDSPLDGVAKVNTIFEREYNNAMDNLKLSNKRGVPGVIFGEIMISLLHCRQVLETDSIPLSTLINFSDILYNPHTEKDDSCKLRIKKNYTEIMKHSKIGEYTYCVNAYWDEKNNRIYQYINMWNSQEDVYPFHIKLKNYRLDCFYHSFIL